MMMTTLSRHGGWRCWAWAKRRTKMVDTMREFPVFSLPCLALSCLDCYILVSNTLLYHFVRNIQRCGSISCNYFLLLFYSILVCPLVDPSLPILSPLSYYYLFTDSTSTSSPLLSSTLLSSLKSSHLLSCLLYLLDDDDDSPKKKKNGAQSWRKRDEGT